ncbi:MAG: hypothetical protein GWN37_19985 [Gammaproteobacteria bacterium]|nr:hypothetical protein [Gammaproteobacteria bacterium]
MLEMLHAEALPPGRYTLQLVVVKTDGNFIEPYQVRIDIVPPPGPDATATPTAQPQGQ